MILNHNLRFKMKKMCTPLFTADEEYLERIIYVPKNANGYS